MKTKTIIISLVPFSYLQVVTGTANKFRKILPKQKR